MIKNYFQIAARNRKSRISYRLIFVISNYVFFPVHTCSSQSKFPLLPKMIFLQQNKKFQFSFKIFDFLKVIMLVALL